MHLPGRGGEGGKLKEGRAPDETLGAIGQAPVTDAWGLGPALSRSHTS